MNKICIGLVISLLSASAHAQVVNLEWVKSIGGTADEIGQSITIDLSGNVYITGSYQGTVDFDPSASSFDLTSNGFYDVFIQKLDASGNFIWAKSMGGIFEDFGYSITTDASGNVYVTGFFHDTADFDPGISTFNLISNGLFDVFIQKLDANGNFIWAKSMGGTLWESGQGITTDIAGNVYITGYYWDVVDFDPGVSTFILTSNGFSDIFIQKLDVNGNFIWAKSMGGISDDFGYSITTDASNGVCVTGSYQDTTDFDPSASNFNLTSNGLLDVFIQKLDTSGSFIWAKSMGGTSIEEGRSIITDISGNVYVTGNYLGTADFDPSVDSFNLTSNGLFDGFIQKLDPNGNFIWAKSVGGILDDYALSIATDALGNVYVTGDFQGVADFDPSAATYDITSNGSSDIFIQKLDASGNLTWIKSMGGISDDFGMSVATSTSGNVYITGFYEDIVDFDPNATIFNLTSTGGGDVFIQKLSSTVGIDKNALINGVSIFPNPNNGLVKIDLGGLKDVSIKAYSVSGQLVYSIEVINATTHQFELNEAPGIYVIEIRSQSTKQHYKLVKM